MSPAACLQASRPCAEYRIVDSVAVYASISESVTCDIMSAVSEAERSNGSGRKHCGANGHCG